MFLRSLTLRGFKSFADRTALDFVPGVSVIVGPNGSGKSNLVDAISWALGQQGPRALRGGQMADVIFAGGPARRGLGMAEVKLVIDNSAGKIPLPVSEIEISRTIFRSGESEYRIGGQICRLLDIQELLSETGIGRALHTVVGQGQLEEVLTAKPEERRRYIEEAAGIAKHRQRKERAHRKLQSLDQDLLRLQDVLAELRRQLKPLKQQAEVARRHEKLTAEAGDLAARLAAARLRALRETRESRREGWDEGLALRQGARERIEELDEQVGAAAEERERAAAALHAAELAFQEAQAAKSAGEAGLRAAVESESAARAKLASEASRTARLAAAEEEIARVESALAETTEALRAREGELEIAEAEFRERERARRDAEEERRRISEETAARRAEIETLRRSIASYEHEQERLDESLAEVRGRIAAGREERERLEAEIERLDAETTPLGERRSALERERNALASRVAELEEALRRQSARRDLLGARLSDIEETPGVRFARSHPGRTIGLLRDLVRVDEGLEAALAAALGPMADAAVYEDDATALEDAPEGAGATIAVASGASPSFALEGERGLLSAVTADARARGLVCTVLRDVYMAADVSDAAAKQRRHPKASFVTPDGVMVGPAVIRTARRADERVREIRDELSVVEHDRAATEAALRSKRERLEEATGEIAVLSTGMDAADAEITSAAERMSVLAAELSAAATEEELLAGRAGGLEEASAAWRDSLAAEHPGIQELPELPRIPEPPMAGRVEVETLRREVEARRGRLERLRLERVELSSEDPAALRSALESAEAERAACEERLGEVEAAMEAAAEARSGAAAAGREATERESATNRAWREAAAELERLREAYEEEDRVRGDLERRMADAERLLSEGHGRDPDEVVAALGEDETQESLERRSDTVARRLGLLGRVNLLAYGEFEALQERHDFLEREMEDVRKARRDLLDVIRRVAEEMVAVFGSAFRDVATEFETLFNDLFPGGEGRIVMTDPADPLASGIEIEARPGRKRVKRISLLSGGERALTALAFLFAIFRARPTPFYLMDEVEPALDDINLARFLKLVGSLDSGSQVLVVTHQKRTMETAGMLYGVSMGKDGTSKVVCQRLEEPPDGRAGAPETLAVPEANPVG